MNIIKFCLNGVTVLLFSVMILPTIVQSTEYNNSTTEEYELAVKNTEAFTDAELAQILAPIALYPDTLLTHILIAATYPLEVIAADRWLTENPNKYFSKLDESSLKQIQSAHNWDASIIALMAFPKVLNKLSLELSWTRKLGDAFIQDEKQVMASIQLLRNKAEQVGSLQKMDNVTVSRDNNNIVIQPVQREIVYVPYYDTRVVYGHWSWHHYPPVHWASHHYVSHHSPFYWHSGVHIGINFFSSAFHWNNHHIVINHYNRRPYQHHSRIVRSHHAKRWSHNPKHRRGVAYRSNVTKERYSSNRHSFNQNKKVRATHWKNSSKQHITKANSRFNKANSRFNKAIPTTNIKNKSYQRQAQQKKITPSINTHHYRENKSVNHIRNNTVNKKRNYSTNKHSIRGNKQQKQGSNYRTHSNKSYVKVSKHNNKQDRNVKKHK